MSRAENIEKAIECCELTLQVLSPGTEGWAAAQGNLASFYLVRIHGDRAQNIEQAIQHGRLALKVYKRDTFPEEWAQTQANLADALCFRVLGDREENLEAAIRCAENALRVRIRERYPEQWAATHARVGVAYLNRTRDVQSENIEKAIRHLKLALEIFTHERFPEQWAHVQNDLGLAYGSRILGECDENLKQAIYYYEQALRVRTREAYPEQWAETQSNLALAYRDLGRRDEAIKAWRDVLSVYTPPTYPLRARIAARNLGNLLFDLGCWTEAYTAYATAVQAAEIMYRSAYIPMGKEAEVGENVRLYGRMVQTCFRLGEGYFAEAMVHTEASKARTFLDQMGYGDFPLPPLPLDAQPFLTQEQALIQELRGLENALRNTDNGDLHRQLIQQQGEKRTALDDLWRRLEFYAPNYVTLRRGDPISFKDLQALVDQDLVDGTHGIQDVALVEFYTLEEVTLAFVLRTGQTQPWAQTLPLSQVQLLSHVQNYWREVPEHPDHPRMAQRWQDLAAPLLGDILPYLDGADLVYLVPHGLLHYLPIHALGVNGKYLIDRFPIAYAPSAAVLRRVKQRGAHPALGSGQVLVLGYTANVKERPVFEGEAKCVASLFKTAAYLGAAATSKLVWERGDGCDLLHFSCHGRFNPISPLDSEVQLADGPFTAREIMSLRLNTSLVTLSACETGLTEPGSSDELVGLTRALLYAGASSVLVTLWSVNPEAAWALMGRFYCHLRSGKGRKPTSKVQALQAAMLERREEDQWSHPYYWAPFILVGDWQ